MYAFLTVLESLVNAVYWFRTLQTPSLERNHQINTNIWAAFYYTFKFVLILWMALPQFGCVQIRELCRYLDCVIDEVPVVHRLSSAHSSSQSSPATSPRADPPLLIFAPRPIRRPSHSRQAVGGGSTWLRKYRIFSLQVGGWFETRQITIGGLMM